jgi:hypothetical protein
MTSGMHEEEPEPIDEKHEKKYTLTWTAKSGYSQQTTTPWI